MMLKQLSRNFIWLTMMMLYFSIVKVFSAHRHFHRPVQKKEFLLQGWPTNLDKYWKNHFAEYWNKNCLSFSWTANKSKYEGYTIRKILVTGTNNQYSITTASVPCTLGVSDGSTMEEFFFNKYHILQNNLI